MSKSYPRGPGSSRSKRVVNVSFPCDRSPEANLSQPTGGVRRGLGPAARGMAAGIRQQRAIGSITGLQVVTAANISGGRLPRSDVGRLSKAIPTSIRQGLGFLLTSSIKVRPESRTYAPGPGYAQELPGSQLATPRLLRASYSILAGPLFQTLPPKETLEAAGQHPGTRSRPPSSTGSFPRKTRR